MSRPAGGPTLGMPTFASGPSDPPIPEAAEEPIASVRPAGEGYPRIGRAEFFAHLEPLLAPEELFRVETAYNLSKYGHRTQTREDGTRFFEHPRAVAWILIRRLRTLDWHSITLALLHDIPEDSYIVTWQLLERLYGAEFVRDLKLLTKDPKDGYLERLREFGLNNLETLGPCTPEERARQIRETRAFHLPLADVLRERLPEPDRWKADWLQRDLSVWCDGYDGMSTQPPGRPAAPSSGEPTDSPAPPSRLEGAGGGGS